MERRWPLRLVTLLVWAVALASAGYWGWRFNMSRQATALPPVVATAPAASVIDRQQDIARLLGANPTAGTVANASRFSLLGVVTAGAGGAALLSVDGQPARPYPLGGRIDENTVLQSVGPRHVVLAASMDGPALQRLDLPAGSASISAPPANNPAPAPAAQGAMPSSVPPNPPGAPSGMEMRRPDPGPAGPPQAPR